MSALEKAIGDLPLLNEVLRATDEEGYDKTAHLLLTRLSKLSATDLSSKEILENLPASVHTLAYLAALNAAIDSVQASGKAAPRQLPASLLPEGSLWPFIARILFEFDPIQVRYAGRYLSRLITIVKQGAEQTKNYVPAIQLLNHLILRLDPTSSTFTSTHRDYVRLCLLAGAFTEATDILNMPLYHIPAVSDKQASARSYNYLCSNHDISATYLTPATGLTLKITSRGYLEYYMFGALCYIGLGQHKKALTFLEIVILSPTSQQLVSKIQTEAYKKWVLLNLLLYGYVKELRGTQPSAIRTIRNVAKPYDCIAEAFKDRDIQRLHAEINEGGSMWEEETNFGLMQEVYHAHRRFAIKRLGETYEAMPVRTVAQRTSPNPNDVAESLSYLKTLIQNGLLSAKLEPSKNGTDQILRFQPDTSTPRTEAEIENELAQKTQQLQTLLKHINDVDHRTELSKEYIEYLRKLKKTRDEDNKKDSGGSSKSKQAAVNEWEEDVMEEF